MFAFLALLPTAWPCAGFVTPDSAEQLASSDAQQAILNVGAATVSVEYRVRYAGNAADFAWIIPVPGKVEQVAEGSEERFVALEAATAPTVQTFHYDGEEAGGCDGVGCINSKYSLSDNVAGGDTGGGRGLGDDGISIVAEGYAGGFEYTVLEAVDADFFVAWLEAEGYDTSVSAASIAAYVEDDVAFSWVTVRLAPEVASTPDGGVVLPPLRIQWSAGDDGVLRASYPARMAATSMLTEVRTELFVLGQSRVTLGNGWTEAAPMDAIAGGDGSMSASDVYTATLRGVGGAQAAMLPVSGGRYDDEAAGDVYVTRFDTIVAPATNRSDVTFTETGDTESFETRIVFETFDDGATGALWLLPLGLGGLMLRRRRE